MDVNPSSMGSYNGRGGVVRSSHLSACQRLHLTISQRCAWVLWLYLYVNIWLYDHGLWFAKPPPPRVMILPTTKFRSIPDPSLPKRWISLQIVWFAVFPHSLVVKPRVYLGLSLLSLPRCDVFLNPSSFIYISLCASFFFINTLNTYLFIYSFHYISFLFFPDTISSLPHQILSYLSFLILL